MPRTSLLLALLLFSGLSQAQEPGTVSGPSSSESPYLLPTAADVRLVSILSVGDAADDGYRMVGNPDGLGVVGSPDGTFTVFMNHELSASSGSTRAHGSTGAFVSRWVIRRSDLQVLSGRDFVRTPSDLKTWSTASSAWVSGSTTFSRLCSADRGKRSAYWNPVTGKGARNAFLHLTGEENGVEGRVFAFVHGTDTAWELPSLGRMSVENVVANPLSQDKTVVAVTDDSSVEGQVYIYVGTKQATGNTIEKAGLHGGRLYAVKVSGNQNEDASSQPFGSLHDGTFALVDVTPVTWGNGMGSALNTATKNAGGTHFLRPEDAGWLHWRHPERLVFSTTSGVAARSRLWQLTFTDIRQPELGGTIAVLADGGLNGALFQMADNLAVDLLSGHIVFSEDVGNNARLGKVWAFRPSDGRLVELAAHDPGRFLSGAPGFLTQNEESSGVVDITWIFHGVSGYDTSANRYYLITSMAHYNTADPELVQGGQLMLLQVPVALLQ